MEVRFRPLQASTLAGRVTPGQGNAEGSQSFLEVVESVAGTENSLREKTGSNPQKQAPHRETAQPMETISGAAPSDTVGAEQITETPVPKAPSPEKNPVGLQIDMTA